VIKQCRMYCEGGERELGEEGGMIALPAVCPYAPPCMVA
jgi:hypothetical protein